MTSDKDIWFITALVAVFAGLLIVNVSLTNDVYHRIEELSVKAVSSTHSVKFTVGTDTEENAVSLQKQNVIKVVIGLDREVINAILTKISKNEVADARRAESKAIFEDLTPFVSNASFLQEKRNVSNQSPDNSGE